MYELPIGPTKRYLPYKGAAGKFFGGWEVAWFVSYQSGTPMASVAAIPSPFSMSQARAERGSGRGPEGLLVREV